MSLIINLLQMYMLAIVVRVILSWVQPGMKNQFSYMLYRVTEPVLAPLRRVIPPIGGGLDLAPLVAILLIQVLIKILL